MPFIQQHQGALRLGGDVTHGERDVHIEIDPLFMRGVGLIVDSSNEAIATSVDALMTATFTPGEAAWSALLASAAPPPAPLAE